VYPCEGDGRTLVAPEAPLSARALTNSSARPDYAAALVASWPQAASMSWPRVSLIVARTP
jgi:hypothetical protein